MKSKGIRNMLVITIVLLFTGAGFALAHDGWYGGRGPMMGYGGHMMGYGNGMMGYGYNGGMMGYGYNGGMMGPGYGPGYGNLSKEDYAKLETARDQFFEKTQNLRRDIDEKSYALQTEINKSEPDTTKLKKLQAEISQLQSEYDAMALDYNLQVRKILPEDAQGPAFAGAYRGGNCW